MILENISEELESEHRKLEDSDTGAAEVGMGHTTDSGRHHSTTASRTVTYGWM
jgi:hypothetical protein